jgi:uncharacterized membrane protein
MKESMKQTFSRRLKFTIASLLTLCAIGFTLVPTHGYAIGDASREEACASIGASNCQSNGGSSIGKIMKTVTNVFSVVVGFIAVIMIIIGGMKYVTSGGDASKVASAKNTLIYAIVGLVIVALAQFIAQFTLKTATTADLPTAQTITIDCKKDKKACSQAR